jgi:hypothetical protein
VLLPSWHKFTFFSGSPFLNAEIWMHWTSCSLPS